MKAARDAVLAAEKITTAECERRGPRCRERESEEAATRASLSVKLSNAALTATAQKLDTDAAIIRARLGSSAPVVDADPQASAFSQLTGIPVALSAALNAFWLSLAFELGAMFTMLIAYSNTPAAPSKPNETAPTVDIPQGGNVVSIESARVLGDPGKFALARLTPTPGKSVAIAELHEPYQRWCSDEGCRALGQEEFAAQFAQLCEFAGVRKRTWHGYFVKRPKLAVTGSGSGGGPLRKTQKTISNPPGLLGLRVRETTLLGWRLHGPKEWGLVLERSPAHECRARLIDKETGQHIKQLWWSAPEGKAVPVTTISSGQSASLYLFTRRQDEALRYFVFEPDKDGAPVEPPSVQKFDNTRHFIVEIRHSYGKKRFVTEASVVRGFDGRLSWASKGGGGSF